MSHARRNQPQQQPSMDSSAAADGARAFNLGFPRGSCPLRGSHRGKIEDWMRGWDQEARKAQASTRH
jgi:hypothetical protein